MAFGHWQIGLHIQQDSIVSVALTPGRAGWRLCRWWQLELPTGTVENGHLRMPQHLLTTLAPWRRALPQRHSVRLAFPAAKTLQKRVPQPAMRLRDSALTNWLSHTMARELAMAATDLRFDYSEDALSPAYHVTAAQHKDVAELLTLAKSLRLNLSAITPDASALQQFIPFLNPPAQCLVWQDDTQWLWATRTAWGRLSCDESVSFSQLAGRLGLPDEGVITCSDEMNAFDPWQAVAQRQPPLPMESAKFAVAIGLALSGR
jgi:pilus assembly protein HofM